MVSRGTLAKPAELEGPNTQPAAQRSKSDSRERVTVRQARAPSAQLEYRFYRWMQSGFAIFLCVYLAIAAWRESTPGQGEVFPIASWSLFSLVPNICNDFSLRLLDVNGKPLAPARFFEDSRSLFSAATDHAARVVIDRMGKAMEAGAAREAEDIRLRFDAEYLRKQAHQVRYELVAREYDPLERWSTGKLRSVRVLGSYETRDR